LQVLLRKGVCVHTGHEKAQGTASLFVKSKQEGQPLLLANMQPLCMRHCTPLLHGFSNLFSLFFSFFFLVFKLLFQKKKKNQIVYDDGEVEHLVLSKEQWREEPRGQGTAAAGEEQRGAAHWALCWGHQAPGAGQALHLSCREREGMGPSTASILCLLVGKKPTSTQPTSYQPSSTQPFPSVRSVATLLFCWSLSLSYFFFFSFVSYFSFFSAASDQSVPAQPAGESIRLWSPQLHRYAPDP